MKKLLFLANRSAGKGRASKRLQFARRQIWGWPCEFLFTDSPEETNQICSQLDDEKYRALILVGGDGTINQVLPAISSKKIPLIPFPAGSANDLSSELGIPWNWDRILEPLAEDRIEKIDLVQVNGKLFVTVGGMGVGSMLTEEYNEKRKSSTWFSWLAPKAKSQIYTFLSVKTILLSQKYQHRVRVTWDSDVVEENASAIFVCNQGTLGGDICLSPKASNADGVLDVVLIPSKGRKALIESLISLKEKKIPEFVRSFQTKKLLIEDLDGREISFFGDGEILCSDKRLEVSVLPSKLNVVRVLQ